MTGDSTSSQTDGYDGNGLRAWKQSSNNKTYFLYDGTQPICEYSGSGALLAVNSFGVSGLVSRHTTTSTFYTFDERGNVTQRMSDTGSVLSSDLYDAYGTRSSTGGSDVFGFGAQAGYYTDTETGLILCTHRYYDPSNRRWLTRDPLGYKGGVNLYGYCSNDPGNSIDPSGFAQLIEVPTFAGDPFAQHKYIKTNCGSGPPQSFGFYPNPTGFAGGAFGSGGDGAINGVVGGINVYDGTNSDPDSGPGYLKDIDDWSGDPAFGKRLCDCIAKSQASHPTYSIDPRAFFNGTNVYVCYTWAEDMWDCAGGHAKDWSDTIGDTG